MFRDTKNSTVDVAAPTPDALWERVNDSGELEVYDLGINDTDEEIEQPTLEDSNREARPSRESYVVDRRL